jgi:glycosyltransferase involved in cell wall biosynthesis
MNSMINFSIIIPHRNIPALLERLINSIPVRNDLEIIVVDDCSDANAIDQLRSIERHNLTLVLNQECHGAGYARNCALPLTKGEWVLFADSDDYFNSGFNDFLNEYTDSDADIVYFNANSVDTDTYEPSNRVDHLHEFIEEYHKDKNKGELIMRYLFTEPWCKMVKREIIESHHIKFEETSIRNDVKYSYLVGHYAAKIIVDDRQLYCVTTRQNSVSRGKGHQAALDELKVFVGWKKFFIDHQIPLDLPKFDLCAYNFTRHLWKDNKLFRVEYGIMREGGLSHTFIIGQILKYIYKSMSYKI